MEPYLDPAVFATWLATEEETKHVRAELLTSLELLLGDQPKELNLGTDEVLALWATLGNAMREYLRGQELAAAKASQIQAAAEKVA